MPQTTNLPSSQTASASGDSQQTLTAIILVKTYSLSYDTSISGWLHIKTTAFDHA
jgi:hypothetical protein